MRLGRFHRRSHRGRHSGYMLLAILFMMFLMMLALTVAAPRIAQAGQRAREEEMVHRGAQYARAIKKFYKKFGRYPVSIDQLKDTNHIRFLRKEYKDPMTKDGKWKLLHVGDVKFKSGGMGLPASSMGTGLNSSNIGQSNLSGQSTGLGQTSGLGQTPGFGQTTGFGQNSGLGSNPGTTGQNPSSSSTGAQSNSGLSTSNTSGGSSTGFGNPTFGGGAIIGVASVSKKEGLKIFDDKSKYNEWYFVYDPMTDRGALIQEPYTGKVFTGAGASGLAPSQGMPSSPGSITTTPMSPQSPFGSSPQQQPQPQQPQIPH